MLHVYKYLHPWHCKSRTYQHKCQKYQNMWHEPVIFVHISIFCTTYKPYHRYILEKITVAENCSRIKRKMIWFILKNVLLLEICRGQLFNYTMETSTDC